MLYIFHLTVLVSHTFNAKTKQKSENKFAQLIGFKLVICGGESDISSHCATAYAQID